MQGPNPNTSPLDAEGCLGGDGTCASADDRAHQLREACVCAILDPGDAVLIPQGWWHHVTSMTVSFSVSFWWDAPEDVSADGATSYGSTAAH